MIKQLCCYLNYLNLIMRIKEITSAKRKIMVTKQIWKRCILKILLKMFLAPIFGNNSDFQRNIIPARRSYAQKTAPCPSHRTEVWEVLVPSGYD